MSIMYFNGGPYKIAEDWICNIINIDWGCRNADKANA